MAEKAKACPHCADPCVAEDGGRTTVRTAEEKKALITRCNRIEGQIRGIRGMIEKDTYCDDILNQISAAESALGALSRLLLERHLRTCVVSRVQAGEPEVMDELLKTVEKLMK